MISELLVDLFCECRSCFVVRCFGFERFQYTNATGLVYFHRAAPVDVHQASTHIVDQPHSATGEGCDHSEE